MAGNERHFPLSTSERENGGCFSLTAHNRQGDCEIRGRYFAWPSSLCVRNAPSRYILLLELYAYWRTNKQTDQAQRRREQMSIGAHVDVSQINSKRIPFFDQQIIPHAEARHIEVLLPLSKNFIIEKIALILLIFCNAIFEKLIVEPHFIILFQLVSFTCSLLQLQKT